MTTVVRKRQRRKQTERRSLQFSISKLVGEHGPAIVRAALIQSWILSNEVSDRCLRRCEQTQQFLDPVDQRQWLPVSEMLRASPAQFSLKDLEHGLELLNETTKRRHQGIVYTPNDVIDYLLTTAIEGAASQQSVPVICDPACGSGGFLLRAARLLSERFGISLGDAVREHVVGFDRDEESLANARCLIELSLAQQNDFTSASEARLICCDSLLTPPTELLSLAGIDGGCDVVASNPPYVKLQNLSPVYRKQLEALYQTFIKGSYSLSLLFLIAGYRMLNEQGQLAFITQNNFFTSLAGEPIRQFLQQHGCLRRILDFGHAKVFDNAGAYTCLVFLGREPRDEFEYECVEQPPTRETLGHVAYSQIPVTKLNAKKWRLAKPHHLDNLERIERAGKPLGEIAEIRVGFATLKDSVFLVRDVGKECLAIGPNGEDVIVEREITRQAVKVADVTEENELQHNRVRIIFPYRKSDRGYAIVPQEQLSREFPLAFAHLESCRHLLDARDKGKPNPEEWYAWGRTQGRNAPGPKLLTKTFDCHPNFMLDQSDQLFCNGYSVALRDNAPAWLTLEILQRLLNSPVMHYYAKLTSFQIAGGFQCYQKNFIERFGIPSLSADDVRDVSTLDADSRDQFVVTKSYGLELREMCEIISRE